MTAQPRLRVAVDANPLIGERTGIGHVTARLLEGLALRDDVEVTGYAVTRTGRRDLAGLLPSGILPATSWVPARIVHPLWTRISWPTIEHWTGPVDVVHSPNFIAPPPRVPVIVSVHDLAFAHSPELCRPEAQRLVPLLRHALARGAIVHTGSDFVAAEIREFFDLPPERVARGLLRYRHPRGRRRCRVRGRARRGRPLHPRDRHDRAAQEPSEPRTRVRPCRRRRSRGASGHRRRERMGHRGRRRRGGRVTVLGAHPSTRVRLRPRSRRPARRCVAARVPVALRGVRAPTVRGHGCGGPRGRDHRRILARGGRRCSVLRAAGRRRRARRRDRTGAHRRRVATRPRGAGGRGRGPSRGRRPSTGSSTSTGGLPRRSEGSAEQGAAGAGPSRSR